MQLTHLREKILTFCFIIFGLAPHPKQKQQNKTNNKETNKTQSHSKKKKKTKKRREKQQALTASHSLDNPTI